MRNKPTYSIESVDHALRLITLLRMEGPLRVTDVAERLGVAASTAHRLLTMLVYRDYAEQDDQRRYLAGPAVQRPLESSALGDIRRIAMPHLEHLTAVTHETSSVMSVLGGVVRFLATAECDQVLRVGDREGRVLPAHLASGGRAVLANLDEEEVRELYGGEGSPVGDMSAFLRGLQRVRRQHFAVNNEATEVGVSAIGCAIAVPSGVTPAAISLSVPTVRFRRDLIEPWTAALASTADRIGQDLWRWMAEKQ